MQQNNNSLKSRFINAIASGELGKIDEQGIVFTLKEFKAHFSEIKTDYINSFLPASTMEAGRIEMTNTKFLFRIRKGVYRVHPDLLLAMEGQAMEDQAGKGEVLEGVEEGKEKQA